MSSWIVCLLKKKANSWPKQNLYSSLLWMRPGGICYLSLISSTFIGCLGSGPACWREYIDLDKWLDWSVPQLLMHCKGCEIALGCVHGEQCGNSWWNEIQWKWLNTFVIPSPSVGSCRWLAATANPTDPCHCRMIAHKLHRCCCGCEMMS